MTSPPITRPTSADVAKAAGVSRATVSFVLNDKPGQSIPESTRVKVLNAAEQLGYVANPMAKALRTGSRIVLTVMPDWPYGSNTDAMHDAIAAMCLAHNYGLYSATETTGRGLSDILEHLQPALVVRVGTISPVERKILSRRRIPYLETLGSTDIQGRTFQTSGATTQVEHLVSRGHTCMAYLGTNDPRLREFNEPRQLGVAAALAKYGHTPLASLNLALDLCAIKANLEAWRAAGVTALCCYNDVYAIAAMRACHELGLQVPEDMAIIGIDNDRLSALTTPSLTSVALDVGDSLTEVLSMAFEALEAGGDITATNVELVQALAPVPRLIRREST